MAKKVTRLYQQFKPEHYDLSISLDHEGLKFSGLVKIKGRKTGRPSQRITLHQKDLKIISAKLTHLGKKDERTELSLDRINTQKSFDEVRLHCEKMVYPGEYEIELEFSGDITKPMDGIYPCYFEQNGKKQHLLATQFESHHARQAFPCIDEPEAKATFKLDITTKPEHTVISNTPIENEKKAASSDRLKTTYFETTPVMSTYLLAFVTGNVGFKEAKTKSGILVRAYATPDNVAHTDFALDTAVKCLDFYEDYFGIAYPLNKCDMIALPDFASGAMENWGCVTYREQCMLVDERHTSLTTKQFAGLVVAHELAHQWFGNLVTMEWWTDLWLNEGFASWIEYLACNHIFPEWQLWTQFLVDDREQALKLDALDNTHAVEVPVGHPDEIRTIFDAISYSKGASLINMLHDYLGPDDFRDGLRHYLKKHAYKNTVTADLWASLEEISGKPVVKFMHDWTSLPGFPVVHAEQTSEKELKLKQERFYLRKPEHPSHKTWPIPLLASADDSRLLSKHSESYDVTDGTLLNQQQNGFYRTSYSHDLLQQHAKLVKNGKLDVHARLGLLSDAFESSKAGFLATTDALELLQSYKGEDNTAVWDVIASGLATIRSVMDTEELRDLMKPFVINLVAPQIKRLGWDKKKNESHFDSLLRPIVLAMAAVADDPSVVAECHELFRKMHEPADVDPSLTHSALHTEMRRNIEIDPDMRGVVYGTIARHGAEPEFDKLLHMHNTTTNSEERTNIAAALTGFRQPELIERALELITTDTVRLQDVAYWTAYSFMNRFARNATWKWMENNWGWLEQNFAGDLGFYRMPIYAARSFSDPDFGKKYREFFESKRSPAFNRSIDQGLEIIEWHKAWRSRDLNSITKWFKS